MKNLYNLNRLSASVVRVFAAVVVALVLSSAGAQAATLSWDPGLTKSISDGSGPWVTTTTANWASGGAADVIWINGSDASIGAGGLATYDLAVKTPITVGNITFNQMGGAGAQYSILCTSTLTIGGTVTCNNTVGTSAIGKGAIDCGSVTFTKDGAGQLKLSSATLTTSANPAVRVMNGILQTSGLDNTFPTSGVLQVDSSGTFDLAGKSQTLAALTGSGAVKNSTGTSVLTVGNNNGSGSFSGRVMTGSGLFSLTKTGSGTQTMNGTAANAHTGTNTVAGGTLTFATGSPCANAWTVVNSGSGNTLGVQLASADAKWACSNLVFGAADGGTYALAIDYNNTTPSTTVAPIVCSNLLTHSTITLTVSGFTSGFATAGTYPLISYNPASATALTSGEFGNFTLGPLPSGFTGNLVNDTANFLVSLQITGVPCTETVTISPSSPLTAGTANVAYSQTLTGSGGTGPYTFSVVGGSLPSGFSLDSGGLLSGTTTLAGTYDFTVQATDTANGCFNSYPYSLTINPGAVASYTVTAASPQIQYNAFSVTVTAKDAWGNTVTADSSTVVTMSSSTGNVQFDSNGDGAYGDATKTLSGGTFTILARDNVLESVAITATDGGANTGTSSSIAINAPATLTWDPGKTPATGSEGSGSWSAGSTAIWANGGADVAWIQGAGASIGVGSIAGFNIKTYPVTVANITFNQTASGGYILSAAFTPTALTLNEGTITVNNTAAPSLLTKLTLVGDVTFTKSGSGVLGLSSCTCAYSGSTVVADGTLRIMNNTQQLPTTSPIQVNSTATLDLNSKDQIVDALTGSGTVDDASTGGSSLLAVGAGNGSGTFSGVIQNSTWVSNGKSVSLTKVGTGTQTLNNANTYVGYTTINAGTLALGSSGSIASTRLIIAAGGTFDVSAIASYALAGTTNLIASGTGIGATAAAIKGGTTVDLSSLNRFVLTNDSVHPSLYISQGTLTVNNQTFYIYSDGSYSVLADGDYTIVQQASGSIGGTVASSVVTGDAVAGKVGTVSIVGGAIVLHVCTPPSAAGAISGPATVNPGDTAVAYSISAVSGATSYTWTVPTGASVASGQGSDSITVNYSCSAVSGNVGVTPVNACGNGAAGSLGVTVNPLPTTSAISGPTTVDANQAGVGYSVTANAGSSYAWTVPSGASITLGQGSSSITVTFGTASGNVGVTETSAGGCPVTPVSLAVTVQNPLPVNITSIAGTTISYTGGGGSQFVLLSSPTFDGPLSGWTRVDTNTVTPGSFTIPAVGTSSAIFYSIKSE